MITSALLLVGTLYFFPYTSPSIAWLNFVYTVGFMFRALKDANPLLIDYIKSDSRGKASGIRIFGVIIGEIFCQAVLIGLTAKKTFKTSFTIVASVLLVMIAPLFCMVKEPTKVSKEAKPIDKISMF